MTQDAARGEGARQLVRFHGGTLGALLPFAAFLAGVGWLAWSGAPDERGFWPLLVCAIGLGTLLARDRRAYCEALVRGMSQPLVALMILAWLLAGMLAAILQAAGFVESVLWLTEAAGLSGGGFVVAAFLVCCLVSTATGTSLGTLVLCTPLLYPAGVALGAEPAVLMGAVLGGATFGDNVSPVSDSTIASAGTQGAAVGDVVRSRMRYALPAAAAAVVVYAWLGGGAAVAGAAAIETSPAALPLLLAPLAALATLLAGRHLVQGLLVGCAVAALVAVSLGLVLPSELMAIEEGTYRAGGVLLSGLERGVGVSIFTLLLTALVGGLEAAGVLDAMLARMAPRRSSAATTEWALFAAISAAVVVTTHSVVALLAVGPLAARSGSAAGLAATRRANLLDLTVCTYPFLLPYCIPIVLAASLTGGGGQAALSPLAIGLHNFHSWALLAMVLIAISTGYGRHSDRSVSSAT